MISIIVMLVGLGLAVLGLFIWRGSQRLLKALLGIFLTLFGILTVWVGSNLDVQYTAESELGPTCQVSGSPVPGMPWCDDIPR